MNDCFVSVLYGLADFVQLIFAIPLWGLFIILFVWQVTRLYDLWRFYTGKSSAFGNGNGQGKSGEINEDTAG